MNATMSEHQREDIKRTLRSHGICVIIPTYNNAATLARIIDESLLYCRDIIVVNDGSTDGTNEILQDKQDLVTVVSYPVNKGKGGALKEGFLKARFMGFKTAITIDSDGQHYPDDIPDFLKAVVANPGALIVGQRDLSNVDINGKSSFANKFSNFWFTVQTGINLKDTQTGYRAYPLDKLYGLGMLTARYEAELELLVFAAWNNVPLVSIPIKVYYPPQAERVSHFRPALDFTRISILNTILCVGALIYGLPVKTWKRLRGKQFFASDFRPFTHKKGERREAAVTLDRLFRSLYGLGFFLFWSLFVFTPYALVTFKFGKSSEKKRFGLHRKLQDISNYIVTHWPGAKTLYHNKGGEDFSRPSLVICNHQSHLDLPLLMAVSPKLIFLTNDWVWNSPFFGKIIKEAEFLPVSAGIESILPQLKDLVGRGYSVVVFPEGTRSADCKIARFHQGAFHLADELGLDIVPMVLHGAGHYLPKKDFMFRRATVSLTILERVARGEVGNTSMLKQASGFRKLITGEYERIADQTETPDYFRSLVSYKYAWRGWKTASRAKSVLKKTPVTELDAKGASSVMIGNSGMGVFALWYALANKGTQVYAFEENAAEHETAASTAGLPPNLHFLNPVTEADYVLDTEPDRIYWLEGSAPMLKDKEIRIINLKS